MDGVASNPVLKRKPVHELPDKYFTSNPDFWIDVKAGEGLIVAPGDCRVVKVLMEEGVEVRKGQPMFVLDCQHPLSSSPYFMSEHKKSEIKKILEEQSGVVVDLVNSGDNMAESYDRDTVMRKYKNFPKFGYVDDDSDHIFIKESKSKVFDKQDDITWFQKRMRKECEDISKNVPENMYVRAYTCRVDLLRFVIVGPSRTPYQYGLFFFDVCFPCNYPDSPPLVCSHSGIVGFKSNPKSSDATPLIIQGTTSRLQSMWVPGTTTMSEYLKIIYHNIIMGDPLIFGLGMTFDRGFRDTCSLLLQENLIINSLKTMLTTMKKPPKFFELFVAGHFCDAAGSILRACFHYKKGKVYRRISILDTSSEHNSYLFESFSMEFRNAVASYIQPLLCAFNKCGAKVELEMQNKKKLKAVVRVDQLPTKFLEVKSSYGVCSIKDVLHEYHKSENTRMVDLSSREDILKGYENFKKFDVGIGVDDHLLLAKSTSATSQLPQNLVGKIHDEWKICKKHLPETMFVRVYEGREDLLRAVFIGRKGTPYQNGLFFFDVCFPIDYPNSPPLVSPHSGVFLNATRTLNKTWVPGTSNILQFLVSIEGLVLSAEPIFFSATMNEKVAESLSLPYNETVIINSVVSMLYTMKNPPKNFEFFVAGHFCKRASEILSACRSYMKGLKIGCYANGNETCSNKFKNDLASCIELLVNAFSKLGAEVIGDEDKTVAMKKRSKASVAGKEDKSDIENKNKKVIGDEDKTVTEKDKSKICQASFIVEEGKSDIENKNQKVIDNRTFLSTLKDFVTKHTQGTFIAPATFMMGKIMVKEGTLVDRGQPLCVTGPEDVSSWIKKILERNLSSHIGIFSLEKNGSLDHSHSRQMEGITAEVFQRSCQNFKKFDTVLDYSDHFFSGKSYVMDQPAGWVNRISEEWRILAENLPDTIFVRVYEDRKDLLRAVIIGSQGTPYHNGLFFFDVFFPSSYPDSPPLVHYNSTGLGINPNLKCGKVHLTLPKTNGMGQETMWDRDNSTMLQLMVSIQDRMLNSNPLFNDITYSVIRASAYAEQSSILYNEITFVNSLKTMVFIIKHPPKDFEAFVVKHFWHHVDDIIKAACDRTCIVTLKNDMESCIDQLLSWKNMSLEPT